MLNERFLGTDMAAVLLLASKGKLNRAEHGWVVIGRGGVSSSKNFYKMYRNRKADILFPFASLTIFANKLTSELKLSDKAKINFVLAKLNIEASLKQVLRCFR